MKTKVLTSLYFLSGIVFITLQYKPVLNALVFKSLLMPCLILLLMINSGRENSRLQWLMFSALFFSWAGDILLEFSKVQEGMFLMGLVSFLLTHVLYLLVFSLTPGTAFNPKKLLFAAVPVILYGAGLLFYLKDDLGSMMIPVTVYAVVILTMLVGAISRKNKVERDSYLLVLTGALLFVVSDSMIAVNRFSHAITGAPLLIMSTYMLGQFLIVQGYIRQYRKTAVQVAN
jgi:uncharacterized membrane protein YhhN